MSVTQGSELIECSDCGLVQRLPAVAHNAIAECPRCGNDLARPSRALPGTTLALSLAAAALLLPAQTLPLMRLTSFGMQRREWLPTGVGALWRDGFASLAGVVALFSIVIPYLYLLLMIVVLLRLDGVRHVQLGRLFRWGTALRPWVMIEVFLIGCCVAYSRLQSVGTVNVGAGGWCLIAATAALVLSAISLDERSVWGRLQRPATPKADKPLISCEDCDLVLEAAREGQLCPRCQAPVHARRPAALQRTLAWIIAGFLMYLPANLLPVLEIERFGRQLPNTILGGIRELIDAGLWPLAVIVFLASVVVPLVKLFGLSLMLWMTRRGSRRWLIGRTRLYRFIDLIGRWSNIDVFMISVLVALVQFGALTTVHAEPGAIAFAAVVIITMFASRSFDSRLMWDAARVGA